MKFLVDAQLPRMVARRLIEAGHDAVHTIELPNGNRTTDLEIVNTAAREQRIVITKDADFVNSFYLNNQPEKLLLISTGNISNPQLEVILLTNLPALEAAFGTCRFVELSRSALMLHV